MKNNKRDLENEISILKKNLIESRNETLNLLIEIEALKNQLLISKI